MNTKAMHSFKQYQIDMYIKTDFGFSVRLNDSSSGLKLLTRLLALTNSERFSFCVPLFLSLSLFPSYRHSSA